MPRFTLDGRTYEVDLDDIDIDELEALHKQGGATVLSLASGYLQGDPTALKGLVWLAKRRAGEAVRWQDIKFKPYELVNQFAGAPFRMLGIAQGPAEDWAERLRALADEIDADDTIGQAEEADPTPPSAPAKTKSGS